ncbi:hypothetical protein B0T20DRAFT_200014 [Sordaria brevicollis]|uniref:Uncharacterized protein n=1 Tax=Sordaria brevicollis TaxID=83679 RepID=A0AAE0UDK0_SORBR|nr:hypothetical protein B0T20DRAFT_200014 [Sordaria brevicollis]
MASDTTNLSPIWQSLPLEVAQMILHEVVSIHLWNIDKDPFYPWDTLRQLNHQQRRRVEAVYRHFLLPHLELRREVNFQSTPTEASPTQQVTKGVVYLSWTWDHQKDRLVENENGSSDDRITLRSSEREYLDQEIGDNLDGFDSLVGWNDHVKSFPPDGLQIDPYPHYTFDLTLCIRHPHGYYNNRECDLDVTTMTFPASHLVPDVEDGFDDDSIRVSSRQLIGAVIWGWKNQIRGRKRSDMSRQWYYIPLDRLKGVSEV